MINVIPAFIFLTTIYLNYRKVKRWICLSNFILFLYFVSSVSFVFFAMTNAHAYYSYAGFFSIFIPTVFLIWPLSTFEEKTGGLELNTISIRKVKTLSLFLTITGFYSLFFFSRNLGTLLTVDIVDLRSGFGSLYQGGTFSSKVACLGAYFYPISLSLFFYNVIKQQISRRLNSLLLISSVSFIVYTLNVAGRDGIVLWTLTFVGLYCFFSIHLPQKEKEAIIKIMRVGVVLFLPLFIFITMSRFDSTDEGSVGSVFSYSGQQLYIMSADLDLARATGRTVDNSRTTFEFFYRVLDAFSGKSAERENRMDNMDKAFNLGFYANSFGTYVNSLYPLSISLWQFILFIIVLFGVYKSCLRTKCSKISSKHLMGALSWYTILISGVFYFYYGTYIGNIFLILSLLVTMVL